MPVEPHELIRKKLLQQIEVYLDETFQGIQELESFILIARCTSVSDGTRGETIICGEQLRTETNALVESLNSWKEQR